PRPEAPEADPLSISVPREVAAYTSKEETSGIPNQRSRTPSAASKARTASACVPLDYVSDANQRIDVYRKLAEITDEEGVSRIKSELRDRFGPLPSSAELLLQVAELKLLASERGVSVIETKEDKL